MKPADQVRPAHGGPSTEAPRAESGPPKRWRVVVTTAVTVIGSVLYPLLVFYGLTRFGPRAVAGMLLVVLVPAAVVRLMRADRASLRRLGFVPLLVIALLATGAAVGRAGFVLLVPAAINVVLAATFAATLWSTTPMIERFARLQDSHLRPPEVTWCRTWTILWTGFFVLNVSVVSTLVVLDWRRAWMYYTGLIAYGLMGMLFASEYVLRKARFGRLADHPLDRALAWSFARFGWRAPDSRPDEKVEAA